MKSVLSFVVAILFSFSAYALAEDQGLSELIWSKTSNKEAIQLINKNPELINSRTGAGFTPLHLAGMVGNKEMATFLLEKGADVNAIDSDGYSPLVRAKANGNQDIADILIKNGGKELRP
ncbi:MULTISPECIES: ankyrin repeat domain-containing protein [Pectobacterium]|uniref:Ankyrin repeat domain-containing protein n=1 Tax=Pectobacterium quasiaquaticum TaxID=2774015 RepID=A0A9Q2ID94_9GAMM|nr:MULTISPECIES: ankyrin repeat domain-containing protein [Pectobacterium]MBE5221623.1 ankyrin repeat domain-containing protein [Pectobacterium quasiaquaticum]MBN3097155.1 ankyrin repeat domain-containing protein [Pectobacterium brasiliense]MBN3102533.1 ankyrin repeat domain-containing protein [Pectobacterium brasiliense]MBN3132928.1 ankyrin repeat domain-containing protein [Pectobacterium brasiliense]MBN3164671.1 ankyrin repeat domain-containing protein [Pectobacterium brasiliense]